MALSRMLEIRERKREERRVEAAAARVKEILSQAARECAAMVASVADDPERMALLFRDCVKQRAQALSRGAQP